VYRSLLLTAKLHIDIGNLANEAKVGGNLMRRRIARWVPGLSRVAYALDRLEAENRILKANHRLEGKPVLRDHVLPVPTQMGPDGIPLPPPSLRSWVAVTDDLDWFLAGGKLGVQTLTDILARRGKKLTDVKNLLDFGCGCGRVLRHLKDYESIGLHGTDCNAAAIRWCDENLNFAEFGTNALEPPLRYRSQRFDLVYAFSIFTHLTEPQQAAWMKELGRVVRPDGLLVITVNGDRYIEGDPLSPEERIAYQRGELVMRREDLPGQNACVAFHPETYVRKKLARGFEILDFIPAGAKGNPPQDAYVLRPLH
jgi:SAM-dependent methyltransferase